MIAVDLPIIRHETLETDGELHLVGSGDLPESTPVIARTRWKPVRKSG